MVDIPQTFIVTLQALPGRDGTHELRAFLKSALRRYGLRAVDVREQVVPENEPERLAEVSRRARPPAHYREEFARLRKARKEQERRA